MVLARFLSDSGDEGIRTPDPLLARQVLSQLSYTPIFWVAICFSAFFKAMGLNGPFLHPKVHLSSGLKWTRTIDLTLIRRAL